VIAQLGGAAVAIGAIRALYPDVAVVTDEVVVPHDAQNQAAAAATGTSRRSRMRPSATGSSEK
jgi:hypothetical protein